MEWFKFYGRDWLTDIKVLDLSIEDRICYITLLCLASSSEEQGRIKKCNESSILKLTHMNKKNENIGFIKRLIDNEMITQESNGDIIINNFLKRQEHTLTAYERVKRYRDKQKALQNKDEIIDNEMITDDNAHDNDRLDKIREDKIRYTGDFSKLLTNKTTKTMYNYCNVDEDGNPILKKRSKKITKEENTDLIKAGLLWRKMCADFLEVKEEEVVMKNIYFPIRALYEREKFTQKDFKELFKYFFDDKNIKQVDKMGFDLAMSEKYVAKYKINKRSQDKPVSNAQIAEGIRL